MVASLDEIRDAQEFFLCSATRCRPVKRIGHDFEFHERHVVDTMTKIYEEYLDEKIAEKEKI